MPHHQSAKKRVRQTKTRTILNRTHSSTTKTAIKKMRLAISDGNKAEASKLLPTIQSLLARLAKKGIVKSNTAARKTSRLTAQINKL